MQGKILDARSDIFSIGVVLYEMISGHAPFEAENTAALISAILSREPMPLTRYALDVPVELERIVRKCLEKDRERRYQTMRDVAIDLENLRGEQASARATVPNDELTTASVRAAVTSQGVRRPGKLTSRPALVLYSLAALLVVAAIVYMLVLRGAPATKQPEIRSIAVLPLDNLSGDAAQDYFADGMTDALITELGKIGELRVISRASVMQYKATRKTMPEIARELNVDAVVVGSVVRSGGRVGIRVQLVYAPTERHLWAESYERDLRDVLSLQSEAARTIAHEINVKLSPQEQRLLASSRPVNPDAYEMYLRGRYYFNQSETEQQVEPLKKSVEYYEQAIKIDPGYAPAYSWLSLSYILLRNVEKSPELYRKAKAAAVKAVQLDDMHANGHASLAHTMFYYEWDWDGAEREYRRAIELDPSCRPAHFGYAQYLNSMGRYKEALAEMKRAEEVDPLPLPIKMQISHIHYCARQYDLAIEQARKTLELSPNSPWLHNNLAGAYVGKGMYEEAFIEIQKALELSGGDPRYKPTLAWAYAMSGKRREALKILDEFNEPTERKIVTAMDYAGIHAALGEKQQALDWLEKAYQERGFGLLFIRCEPEFDSLRSEPRFQDLLRRIGFTQ